MYPVHGVRMISWYTNGELDLVHKKGKGRQRRRTMGKRRRQKSKVRRHNSHKQTAAGAEKEDESWDEYYKW